MRYPKWIWLFSFAIDEKSNINSIETFQDEYHLCSINYHLFIFLIITWYGIKMLFNFRSDVKRNLIFGSSYFQYQKRFQNFWRRVLQILIIEIWFSRHNIIDTNEIYRIILNRLKMMIYKFIFRWNNYVLFVIYDEIFIFIIFYIGQIQNIFYHIENIDS